VFKLFYKALYKKNKKILKEKTNEKIIILKNMQQKRYDNACCNWIKKYIYKHIINNLN